MGGLNPQRAIQLNGSLYYAKPLHEVPDLINDCCDLINMEWKRSRTARLRSIEGSSENFPMSLILLKSEIHLKNEKPEVVGHGKISKLSSSQTKVFIETVVIHPSLRGRGLGKFLMNEIEEICKIKNIKWLYLVTKGQENFYKKLGYAACPPVSIYGCQSIDSDEDINEREEHKKAVSNSVFVNNNISVPPPPPQPTRPLFLQKFLSTFTKDTPVTKTFMKKQIKFK